jgi:GNAT superfamily N-acetyltransferase
MLAIMTRPPDPTLRSVRADDPGELRALIALYEAAIPESERKATRAILAMTTNPAWRVTLAWIDEVPIGFSIVYRFAGGDLALLEYMGVDEAWRGRQIGQALFAGARDGLGAHEALIIEVESDRAPCPDRAQRTRRKIFYRRLGCLEVEGLDYILPLDHSLPPLLNLMVWRPPAELSHAALRDWLERLYRDAYGVPADDRRVETMVAGLPAVVRLI